MASPSGADLPIEAVEIMRAAISPDSLLVEAIDDDGGCHRATFDGSCAEARAKAYAKWAFGYEGEIIGVPAFKPPRPRPTLTVVKP